MLVFLSYIIRQSGKFTFSLLRLLFNCSVYGNMFRIFTTQNGIIGRMSKKGGYKGQVEYPARFFLYCHLRENIGFSVVPLEYKIGKRF